MKDTEGGSRHLLLSYVSVICLEGREQTTKNPSMIVDIPSDTLAKHCPIEAFPSLRINRFATTVRVRRPKCRVSVCTVQRP
jgi:hypothetical protein